MFDARWFLGALLCAWGVRAQPTPPEPTAPSTLSAEDLEVIQRLEMLRQLELLRRMHYFVEVPDPKSEKPKGDPSPPPQDAPE